MQMSSSTFSSLKSWMCTRLICEMCRCCLYLSLRVWPFESNLCLFKMSQIQVTVQQSKNHLLDAKKKVSVQAPEILPGTEHTEYSSHSQLYMFENRRLFILVVLNRIFQPGSVHKAMPAFRDKWSYIRRTGTPPPNPFLNKYSLWHSLQRSFRYTSRDLQVGWFVMVTPPDLSLTRCWHSPSMWRMDWNAPGDPRWSTWTWIHWTL